MTLKRTPGKWDWEITVQENGDERVKFVDDLGREIHPTMGDVKLMAAAPEMHKMLILAVPLLNAGRKTARKLAGEIETLLKDINVEEGKRRWWMYK